MQNYEDTINQYAPDSTGGNGGGDDKKLPESAKGQPAGTEIKNPYGENAKAKAIADGTGKYFALPDGASYDGTTTVDGGAVITIRESKFVWVPVEEAIYKEAKKDDMPKSAADWTTKKYTPMAIKVDDTNYSGILYDYSGSSAYLKYPSATNYQGTSSKYREPDVVSYDSQSSYLKYGITKEGENGLQAQYNKMVASVEKYGGFYVAQYEAGIQNGKVVFKNAHTTEGVTTLDATKNMWYGLYEKMASFTEAGDKFVSSMIWGSQYDAMMNWMAKSGKTVGTANTDIQNNTYVTGNSTSDVINNVYDLYGCHREWTLEAYSTSYRVRRGGGSGFSYSPSNRNYIYPDNTSDNFSSRATLYIM